MIALHYSEHMADSTIERSIIVPTVETARRLAASLEGPDRFGFYIQIGAIEIPVEDDDVS